jgi:hypothetical protein
MADQPPQQRNPFAGSGDWPGCSTWHDGRQWFARTDIGADSWAGRDLGILAGHLFEDRQIDEWAYARDPDSIVWCVRSDGVLLGFTYLKEHDVYAWSRHLTDGDVESVCAIQEKHETALYLSVRREVSGRTVRYVERLRSRLFADVTDAWCVDSGVRYDGWNATPGRTLMISGTGFAAGDPVVLSASGHSPFSAASVGRRYILRSGQSQITATITAYIDPENVDATLDYAAPEGVRATAVGDWALAATTLSGLWHLEGRNAAVLADGSVQPPATVVNGTVSIPRAAGRILAGLPYVCDLETLNIEANGGAGAPTLQGRFKRVQEVVLRVKAARGLAVGPDAGRLTEIKERAAEAYGAPTLLVTGDERVLVDPSWNSNGRVFVRQAWPLPATVVAIVPWLEAGE